MSLNQRCQDLEKQLSEECGRREGAEEGRGRLEGEVEGLRGENSALASQLREKSEHGEELDKEVRRTVYRAGLIIQLGVLTNPVTVLVDRPLCENNNITLHTAL